MTTITVDTRKAVVTDKEIITTGSVGMEVQFSFSSDWDGLDKFVIFRNGDVSASKTIAQLSETGIIELPAENTVQAYVDDVIFAGVYGQNEQGTIVIPTIWASIGSLRDGANYEDPILPEDAQTMREYIEALADEACEEAVEDAQEWATGERGNDTPSMTNNSKYYSQQSRSFSEQSRSFSQDAEASDNSAESFAQESEAWAKGTKDGIAVPTTDPAYQNNSKYYSEQSAASATDANTAKTAAQAAQAQAEVAKNYAQTFMGAPRMATTAEAMTDHDLIYVFIGTTTASLTQYHWYYWDGAAWADGGAYNSSAIVTDPTLTVSGAAADAAACGDLKSATNDLTDCVQHNLIPYACNGSNTNILTVVQNGNEVTINGTSDAKSSQAYTKVLLTDHIYSWNASATPTPEKVYPIKLNSGHTYKLKATVTGGTRDAGEGAGYLSFRVVDPNNNELINFAFDTSETTGEQSFVSTGENVQIRLCVGRLMTLTNCTLRIEFSDITEDLAINGKQDALTFDDYPTENSANPVKSGGIYDSIEEVNNAIERAAGVKPIAFQSGYYYFSNTIGGSKITPEPSATYVCAMSTCNPGDIFTVNVYSGANHMRGYAFLSSALTPITDNYSGTEILIDNQILTAPDDAAYLIVNNKLTDMPEGYYLYKGEPIDDRLDKIEEDIAGKADAFVIPSYYDENNYLTNKLNSIWEHALYTTGDNFVFITDYHAHKNTKHSPAIINKIYEDAGISKVFCGGDIGTSTGLSSIRTNSRAIKVFRNAIPDFFACTGNHEWKVEDSSTSGANYNWVYNYYISQMETKTSHMSDFGDFYIDSKGAKIRYFFLNQNIHAELTDISLKWFIQELPNVPAGYGIVVIMHHAYHFKTVIDGGMATRFGDLRWGDNAAGRRNLIVRRISQILNAVRTGTTVKYALRPHTNENRDISEYYTPYATDTQSNCGTYNPVLSTFDENATTVGDYTDIVTFDGSSINSGVYPIAIFCGHKHEDSAYDPASASSFSDMTDPDTVYLLNGTWYRYDRDTTSQTYGERVAVLPANGALDLSQTETVPPILVILTTTDCYALKHEADPTVREAGTISEQAFDVVQIDTVARKVYCTRIGAGNDRTFSF